MDAMCAWVRDALSQPDSFPLRAVYERHQSRHDSFDLPLVFTAMPEKHMSQIAAAVNKCLAPSLSHIQTQSAEQEEIHSDGPHYLTIRAATEICKLLVSQKSQSLKTFVPVIFALHDVLLHLPNDLQNSVSALCESLWNEHDAHRSRVVPCCTLYLLLRSFGEESRTEVIQKKKGRTTGPLSDIRRVYAIRKGLETLDLSPSSSEASTIRALLLRCATSPAYLQVAEGRKYLAYLLTLVDVKHSIFDALANHLAYVKRSSATLYGTVFLYAWKARREEWLANKLMGLVQKALQAGSEPYATNLRTVFSVFHANKRVNGVDLLLNNIYGPILFRNLMVANPLVRRNSLMVMSDAFPVHDPGAPLQEIEATIEFQCDKFLHLLEDPCCVVRLAAIEGACRVLGLLWELVPAAFPKQVIDLLTSKLAFDASSPRIRLAVCSGIKFLLENYLSHQLLTSALPRLAPLVHDRVERVRLSVLDLLITLKAKRIRTLRYFDVVQVDDLLLRLPQESAAVSAKIMSLIHTSYFPVDRKGMSVDEVAASQTRACLSLLVSNRESAIYFYTHLYLFVPPGPLLEFSMRLASIALQDSSSGLVPSKISGSNKTNSDVRTRRTRKRAPLGENNDGGGRRTSNRNRSKISENAVTDKGESTNKEDLLEIVSFVLQSISPSLSKEANLDLQGYLDGIYGGQALVPLIQQKQRNDQYRAACWRIASCLSCSSAKSLMALWKEQLRDSVEVYAQADPDFHFDKNLVSALLLCGYRWKLTGPLSHLLTSWCEVALHGQRTNNHGTKSARIGRRGRGKGVLASEVAVNVIRDLSLRMTSLTSLRICGEVMLNDRGVHEESMRAVASRGEVSDSVDQCLIAVHLCKASFGVLEFISGVDEKDRQRELFTADLRGIVGCLSTLWRLCLRSAADETEKRSFIEELGELNSRLSKGSVWKGACTIDESSAISLAAICLGHAADAVALGLFSKKDIPCYEKMLKAMQLYLKPQSSSETFRMISEGLRLAFLLQNHIREPDTMPDSITDVELSSLRKVSASIFSVAGDVLNNCVAHDEEETRIQLRKSGLESFLRDIFVEMTEMKHFDDFQEAFSTSLRIGFDEGKMDTWSSFALIVCDCIGKLATSRRDPDPKAALRMFESILTCLKATPDQSLSSGCIQNFLKSLVEVIYELHMEQDEGQQRAPSDGFWDFLTKMENALQREFPHEETDTGDDEGSLQALKETRATLTTLRHMREQDIGQIRVSLP